METKPLLYGLIGFFIGGFIVSVAATTFDKPQDRGSESNSNEMTMSQMTDELANKKGDDFDEAFIDEMISHHQGAIDMAKLSENNAEHEEIKQLSNEIIAAQEKEIAQMKQWQKDWGYSASAEHSDNSH